MSWEAFHWITLAILWAVIVRNVQIVRQWKQRIRELSFDPVEITGLTPLQVQVAMDASEATFCQRIEEMRRARHGDTD